MNGSCWKSIKIIIDINRSTIVQPASSLVDCAKPLFRTSEMMELHKIPYAPYVNFIQQHFSNEGKSISENSIHYILNWTRRHTFYTQYFCHLLFEKSTDKVESYHINSIKDHIYLENENMYYQFKRLLTYPQWKLLSAIANEGIMFKPNSTEFRNRYSLGAASTVNRSLNALIDKEMIFSVFDRDGIPQYQVYDVFLERWIVHKGI